MRCSSFTFYKNRELILTIGTGLVLVLSFFLAYLPMKRARNPERYQLDEGSGAVHLERGLELPALDPDPGVRWDLRI